MIFGDSPKLFFPKRNSDEVSQNSSQDNLLQNINNQNKEDKRKNFFSKNHNYGKQVSMFISSSLRLQTRAPDAQNNRKKFFEKPSKTRAQFFTKSTTRFIRTKSFTKDKKENSPLYLFSLIEKTDRNTKYGQIHHSLLVYDITISILSILSILLTIIDNESFATRSINYLLTFAKMENTPVIPHRYYHLIQTMKINLFENCIRIINGLISFSILIFVIAKYRTKHEQFRLFQKATKHDSMITSGLFIKMVFESIVGVIFFPPYINYIVKTTKGTIISYIPLNSYLSVLTLGKIYLTFPLLKHTTIWGNHIAQTIYRNNKVRQRTFLYLKMMFHNHRFRTIGIITVIIIVILSLFTHFFEFGSIETNIVKDGNFEKLEECFWLITVILIGIGSNKTFPSSFFGRVFTSIAGIIRSLIILLISLTIGNYIFLSEEENRAYVKMKKMFSSENKEQKAVNIIKMMVIMRKFYKRKKAFKLQTMVSPQEKTEIRNPEFSFRRKQTNEHQMTKNLMILEQFFILLLLKFYCTRFVNNYVISCAYSVPINNILKRIKTTFEDNVSIMVEVFDTTENVNDDFLSIAETQNEIKDKIEELIEKQNIINKYLLSKFNGLYYKKEKRFKSTKSNDVKRSLVNKALQKVNISRVPTKSSGKRDLY